MENPTRSGIEMGYPNGCQMRKPKETQSGCPMDFPMGYRMQRETENGCQTLSRKPSH